MNIVNTLLYSNFVYPLLKTLDFLNVQIKTLIKLYSFLIYTLNCTIQTKGAIKI